MPPEDQPAPPTHAEKQGNDAGHQTKDGRDQQRRDQQGSDHPGGDTDHAGRQETPEDGPQDAANHKYQDETGEQQGLETVVDSWRACSFPRWRRQRFAGSP
jgi:hypothetical protein